MDDMQVAFCPFCGKHLNRLTPFCVACGRSLAFLNAAAQTEEPAVPGTSQQPVNAKQTEKHLPSYKQFLDYRNSKSKERQSYNYGGRHRAKERKYVQTNIGTMVRHETFLKPLRGRSLPLFVDPDIEAPDILKKAVQKMRTFNQDTPEGTYDLLYPDCSEVMHVPGSERPFKLAEYNKEFGRPYCRITFFICLEQHFKGAVESDSDSEIVLTSRSSAEFNQADTVVFEPQNQSTPQNIPEHERDAPGHSATIQPGQEFGPTVAAGNSLLPLLLFHTCSFVFQIVISDAEDTAQCLPKHITMYIYLNIFSLQKARLLCLWKTF
ncbi:uncharacterized protein [Takifugu rubripes]|uniref:uncharacterized protein n=1 Tax=Takifugu rubripes TaxID=31033 RepID=UPI001145DCD8|nr:uncharacterized protein LOC115247530 [Takifugu rubripes]